ncbi:MAG: SDR family NAD(P)-dependent oxidoreductase [Lachnospiraceae bacterium]|nr:SDR family NAD(P)-dependent oxidoreductase [Lachnospiraceae bacterium]
MSKTWIITGASAGGIGEGIARAALKKGDNAVVTARSLEKLQAMADEYPETCLPFILDVTDQEAIRALVRAAVDKFGTIDVLVNNAGHGYRSSIEEGEEAAIRELYETNLFGPIHLIREVLPILRAKGSGAILNTTSIAAERSAVGSGYYASSKAALDLLTDGLCKELKPMGIKVMVIEPGSFRTHFYDEALKSAPLTVDAYKDSTWKTANAVNKRQQPGDPMKAGEVVVKMVEAEDAPFRLLLGSDAVNAVVSTAEGRLEEAKKYAEISASTNY